MTLAPLPPAPGEDQHVSLALCNTIWSSWNGKQTDDLSTPQAATRWLVDRGLVPAETQLLTYCQELLSSLRGHIRSLVSARVEGQPPSAATLEQINHALTAAPSARLLFWDDDGILRRRTAHAVSQLVEHAMAQIADDAADLVAGEHAELLAQCQASPCDRFFLRTHGRRQWCSTRCGDRVRAARAYARRATPPRTSRT